MSLSSEVLPTTPLYLDNFLQESSFSVVYILNAIELHSISFNSNEMHIPFILIYLYHKKRLTFLFTEGSVKWLVVLNRPRPIMLEICVTLDVCHHGKASDLLCWVSFHVHEGHVGIGGSRQQFLFWFLRPTVMMHGERSAWFAVWGYGCWKYIFPSGVECPDGQGGRQDTVERRLVGPGNQGWRPHRTLPPSHSKWTTRSWPLALLPSPVISHPWKRECRHPWPWSKVLGLGCPLPRMIPFLEYVDAFIFYLHSLVPSWASCCDVSSFVQVTVAYQKDPHPNKVNLGVGAYRTEVSCWRSWKLIIAFLWERPITPIIVLQEGKPLVLDVVKRAEVLLLDDKWVLWIGEFDRDNGGFVCPLTIVFLFCSFFLHTSGPWTMNTCPSLVWHSSTNWVPSSYWDEPGMWEYSMHQCMRQPRTTSVNRIR